MDAFTGGHRLGPQATSSRTRIHESRPPVVPSEKVRLDPPNLHNSVSNQLLRRYLDQGSVIPSFLLTTSEGFLPPNTGCTDTGPATNVFHLPRRTVLLGGPMGNEWSKEGSEDNPQEGP